MLVLIIDYGMGNLGSVRRSFQECGADVQIIYMPKGEPKEAGKLLEKLIS